MTCSLAAASADRIALLADVQTSLLMEVVMRLMVIAFVSAAILGFGIAPSQAIEEKPPEEESLRCKCPNCMQNVDGSWKCVKCKDERICPKP
jgi:hypothetical protein